MDRANIRLDYIDVLKGFAIFLMVMGHALSWSYSTDVVRTPDNAFVRNLIYAFHMPLFFFLSGYVTDLKNKEWTFSYCKQTLKKRFISLALPCIVWFAISGFNEVPWFLRALFLIICLFTILKYISGKINNDIVEFFILLVFGYLLLFITTRLIRGTALDSIFNMTVFQIHYPYFVLGYLYHKYENKYKTYLDSNYLYTICILIFVALFYIYNWTNHSHGIHVMMRYVLAIAGIYICYKYAKDYTKINDRTYLLCQRMGRISIEIYLLSSWLIVKLPDVFQWVANDALPSSIMAQALFGFVISVPCVIGCFMITNIIGHSKILNLVLFGKR